MKKEACIIMHIVPDYIIAKAAVYIIIFINLLLHSSVYRWSLLSSLLKKNNIIIMKEKDSAHFLYE